MDKSASSPFCILSGVGGALGVLSVSLPLHSHRCLFAPSNAITTDMGTVASVVAVDEGEGVRPVTVGVVAGVGVATWLAAGFWSAVFGGPSGVSCAASSASSPSSPSNLLPTSTYVLFIALAF